MSKHEEIIRHILSLKPGNKISVRSIAANLGVSDGTAYRAIKECETMGIVNTIPRVGTVRVEKIEKKDIETLTFGEVLNITDGVLLGGKDGIHKRINKFAIGAMTLEAMQKYISPECLLIVGNREEAQRFALMNKCGVLITGGFGISDEIKKLANDKCLPVISSTYDTFTIASMINKAISESLIKKDVLFVEDIMSTDISYLNVNDKVSDWKNLMHSTAHTRFPIVDDNLSVVGIVTLNQLSPETSFDESISNIMVKDPITVTTKTTAAYAAHVMGWESGIEFCPVVDGKSLVGILSRQDVIRALQYMARQPQMGDTIEDLIIRNFHLKEEDKKVYFCGKIIPEMLDPIGTASWSSLNMILSTIGLLNLRQKNLNVFVDNVSTYFIRPIQMDGYVEIFTNIIDISKNLCKLEVDMYDEGMELIAKSVMCVRIFRK